MSEREHQSHGDVVGWEVAVRMSTPWPDHLEWCRQQPPLITSVPDDRLRVWQEAVDPGGTGQFQQRLDLGGLSSGQAGLVVSSVSDEPLSDLSWLPFFESFHAACSSHVVGADTDDCDDSDEACLQWLADREAQGPVVASTVPFSALMWPGVQDAWDRLASAEPALVATVGPGAVEDLRLALLSRLGDLVAPTLVLELNAGLTFGQRLLNRITDEPRDAPRSRFARASRALANGGFEAVLLAHPVLPSLIGTIIRQWWAATVEMVERLDRHREDLGVRLGIDPSSVLAGAAITAGDRHNDGRSVAILMLGTTRVAYKPRDTRLEQFWGDLVERLNAHLDGSLGAGLRAARTVVGDDECGHYGFAEFIEHVACTTPAEMGRFYVNAGRTLALLHALSATDCHFENLIAHGDQLVLVDAEALFETRSTRILVAAPNAEPDLPTVLQIGMLPTWLWLDGQRRAIDISALGCSPGGVEHTSYRGWRAVNTDAMTRGLVFVPAPHPVSLPTQDGAAADPPAHIDELLHGFAEAYRAIVAARDAGFVEVIEEARHLSRRLIQRATYVYSALLARSREPEALRSTLDRGLVLEQLTRAYLTAQAEDTWPLLVAEQQAMSRLDVPLFEAALDGSRTTCIDVTVSDWPGVNTLAVVLSRVSRLNEDDLLSQSRLIRASVAGRAVRISQTTVDDANASGASGASGATRRMMAQRCREQIAGDAMRRGNGATWMTFGMLPDAERVNVQPIGSGLYDGALGVAVFLYASGEQALADAAIYPLLTELDRHDPAKTRRQMLAVGLGMSGSGGYLRALRFLATSGHLEEALAEGAISAIIRATPQSSVSIDRNLDLINGAAGLIGPLTRERAVGSLDADDHKRAELLIQAAADRLLAQQAAQGGWRTLPSGGELTGLAHGASGIAVALVEAGISLDEPRYLEAAVHGLAYEHNLFDSDAGNWPDLRDGAEGRFMLGWCAGAPGIALARLRLLDLLPDHDLAEQWRQDLDIAAATTASAPLVGRDHLCCGNLGRAAILSVLGARLGRPAWSGAATRIVEAVVSRAGDGLPRGILGSDPDQLAIPGLMTGQSGAGLVLEPDAMSDWASSLLL